MQTGSAVTGSIQRSHLVLEIVRVETLQPLVQLVRVVLLRGEIDGLGVVEDRILDEDRRAGPERQGDGVARPGVNRHGVAVEGEVDERVKRVLLRSGLL